MKKITTILLAALMSISLAACGGNVPGGGSGETASEQAAQENDNVILIDPVYVPVDDENIKMEITSVSKEIFNEGNKDSEYTCYSVNYTVTNKSDKYEVTTSASVGDCSIGKYTVEFSNSNHNTNAGKINDTAAFTCYTSEGNNVQVSDGAEHITSLEDLLQFEAEVRVRISEDDGKSSNTIDSYKVHVSLIDQKSVDSGSTGQGGADDEPAVPTETLSVGEMASTDVVELTVDSFQFGYKLALGSENPDKFYLPTNENRGLVAGEGSTYFIFDFTVKNIARNSIGGSDICGMDSRNKSSLWTLDYNDGYTYDNGDYADLSLVFGGNYNYSPVMDPLETCHFRGIIKCSEEVETKKDAPLVLHLILPASDGTKEVDYKLR